jgi:hypothetical protein
MRTHPIVLLACALLMAACADGNGPSADGTLLVSTSTGGGEPDQDGYLLAVDTADSVSLEPTGTVAIGLPPGRHALQFLDVADQCSVAPDTVLEVHVLSRDTVRVAFDVSCSATATSGVVGILIEASGPIVHEGFELLLDGVPFTFMPGLRQYLTDVPAGDHVISLLDTPHCSVETEAQPASVTAGDTVQVDFSARCSLPQDSSGTVRVSTPTTGRTPPSTRYTLRYAVAGYWDYGSGAWTFLGTVDPDGTLVSELAASGAAGGGVWWYEFALDGVPANCSVRRSSPTPSHPLGYTITAGDTLDLVFAVTCPP